MDISNLIKDDSELNVIDEGAWVGDFEEAPDVEFLVRGIGSDAAQKALNAKHAMQRKKNRGKELTEQQKIRAFQEVLAEVVLMDWRGLKDGGKDLPYSKELAEKWILSRNGDKFAGMVADAASRLDANTADYVEAVKKS